MTDEVKTVSVERSLGRIEGQLASQSEALRVLAGSVENLKISVTSDISSSFIRQDEKHKSHYTRLNELEKARAKTSGLLYGAWAVIAAFGMALLNQIFGGPK